jgi:hypothetical protein
MKTRTSSYIFTADVLSVNDMQAIEIVRKTVATSNKIARDAAKKFNTTLTLHRVCLKARLGKSNPAYAKYKNQWIKSIKLEDAQRIDVYIQKR